MATGNTKRERHSPDAISARDMSVDGLPLPPDQASAEIRYANKASVSEILQPADRAYLCLNQGEAFQSPILSDNAFVLDDNFSTLKALVQSGRKAKLFYLDPPYSTGLDFYSRDLEHAYNDKMGEAAYLEFMRRRLILMRECMSNDGSIYVHIGHQMVAHLKIIMDEIFGPDNFRNLITRRKCSSKNFTSKQYANLNDFILFYSKTRSYTWNQPGVDAENDWVLREYPRMDEFGRRYKLVPIHAPGTRNGETGMVWRDMMPPPGKHWQYIPAKLEEFDKAGDIYWSKNGNPRRKVYWTADKKRSLTDYWEQYRDAHHQSIQITGYPTEKNLEMMKMIVGASSNEGDLIVDPFCGSGTTLHAARDLGRRFIGIDASFTAAKATLRRMRHGLEVMGDYVNGPNAIDAPKFAFTNSVSPMSTCGFYTERRLYEKYQKEINALSLI